MSDTDMSDLKTHQATPLGQIIFRTRHVDHPASVKSEASSENTNALASPWQNEKTTELVKVTEADLSRVENPSERYGDIFNQLQLKPEKWDDFFTGAVKLIRLKYQLDLKRGTEAGMRNLSRYLLRGYAYKIWDRKFQADWLRNLEEDEQRLLYDRNAIKEEFFSIMEPMWQRMRDVAFVERETPKKRGPKPGTKKARRGEAHAADAYNADTDTEQDQIPVRPPSPPTRRTLEASIHQHVAEMREDLQKKGRTILGRRFISAGVTEWAIRELVDILRNIREKSEPAIFAKLWDERIGRLEELESAPGDSNGDTSDEIVADVPKSHVQKNLANEPFASNGLPERPQFPAMSLIPLSLPSVMTVYISTSPVTDAAYVHRSYIWNAAPVTKVDMDQFFRGIDARVAGMSEQNVKGWVFSYGWNDICRWIGNDADLKGRRASWEAFQGDLKRASEKGVVIWRMKVLVVGA